jgi:hypothetical protein
MSLVTTAADATSAIASGTEVTVTCENVQQVNGPLIYRFSYTTAFSLTGSVFEPYRVDSNFKEPVIVRESVLPEARFGLPAGKVYVYCQVINRYGSSSTDRTGVVIDVSNTVFLQNDNNDGFCQLQNFVKDTTDNANTPLTLDQSETLQYYVQWGSALAKPLPSYCPYEPENMKDPIYNGLDLMVKALLPQPQSLVPASKLVHLAEALFSLLNSTASSRIVSYYGFTTTSTMLETMTKGIVALQQTRALPPGDLYGISEALSQAASFALLRAPNATEVATSSGVSFCAASALIGARIHELWKAGMYKVAVGSPPFTLRTDSFGLQVMRTSVPPLSPLSSPALVENRGFWASSTRPSSLSTDAGLTILVKYPPKMDTQLAYTTPPASANSAARTAAQAAFFFPRGMFTATNTTTCTGSNADASCTFDRAAASTPAFAGSTPLLTSLGDSVCHDVRVTRVLIRDEQDACRRAATLPDQVGPIANAAVDEAGVWRFGDNVPNGVFAAGAVLVKGVTPRAKSVIEGTNALISDVYTPSVSLCSIDGVPSDTGAFTSALTYSATPITMQLPVDNTPLIKNVSMATVECDALNTQYLPTDGSTTSTQQVAVLKRMVCVTWDATLNDWSGAGCKLVEDVNLRHGDPAALFDLGALCECDHFGDIAVFLQEIVPYTQVTRCNMDLTSNASRLLGVSQGRKPTGAGGVFGHPVYLFFAFVYLGVAGITCWSVGRLLHLGIAFTTHRHLFASQIFALYIAVLRCVEYFLYFALQYRSARAEVAYNTVLIVSFLPFVAFVALNLVFAVSWQEQVDSVVATNLGDFWTDPDLLWGSRRWLVGAYSGLFMFIVMPLLVGPFISRYALNLTVGSFTIILMLSVVPMCVAFKRSRDRMLWEKEDLELDLEGENRRTPDYEMKRSRRMRRIYHIFVACITIVATFMIISSFAPEVYFNNFVTFRVLHFVTELVGFGLSTAFFYSEVDRTVDEVIFYRMHPSLARHKAKKGKETDEELDEVEKMRMYLKSQHKAKGMDDEAIFTASTAQAQQEGGEEKGGDDDVDSSDDGALSYDQQRLRLDGGFGIDALDLDEATTWDLINNDRLRKVRVDEAKFEPPADFDLAPLFEDVNTATRLPDPRPLDNIAKLPPITAQPAPSLGEFLSEPVRRANEAFSVAEQAQAFLDNPPALPDPNAEWIAMSRPNMTANDVSSFLHAYQIPRMDEDGNVIKLDPTVIHGGWDDEPTTPVMEEQTRKRLKTVPGINSANDAASKAILQTQKEMLRTMLGGYGSVLNMSGGGAGGISGGAGNAGAPADGGASIEDLVDDIDAKTGRSELVAEAKRLERLRQEKLLSSAENDIVNSHDFSVANLLKLPNPGLEAK